MAHQIRDQRLLDRLHTIGNGGTSWDSAKPQVAVSILKVANIYRDVG